MCDGFEKAQLVTVHDKWYVRNRVRHF